MANNEDSLVNKLIAGIPEQYRYVVEAILEHNSSHGTVPQTLRMEVTINTVREGSTCHSSWLHAQSGISECETRVSEGFARWLVDTGAAVIRKANNEG